MLALLPTGDISMMTQLDRLAEFERNLIIASAAKQAIVPRHARVSPVASRAGAALTGTIKSRDSGDNTLREIPQLRCWSHH